MPATALLTRAFSAAAAIAFAAFVTAKGIPTLRHDWGWPIDRAAIPSFFDSSLQGWLSAGLGTPNPHPTTYLIALPLCLTMWLFTPLAALAALAAVIGYVCTACAARAASHWRAGAAATAGFALFALFNPWVYNQVVAGHLVMVLAYGGLIGLLVEMLRGRTASPVRLALWIALMEAQLQFFLVGMLALGIFAFVTRAWLPVVAGAIVGLPSAVGVVADRGALLRIPYGLEWQTNQSVQPSALLGLGGYFPGYSDALGIVAVVAVWIVIALGITGAVTARRSKVAIVAIAAAAVVCAVALGVHGPLAIPYAWTVRNVPESGVFRELYDLVGIMAALLIVPACAAAARVKVLGYAALVAGVALPAAWLFHPPSNFWIAASSYPHPAVGAPPFTRVAFAPAFQPLGLRGDGGDGADPDAYVYPREVPALNEYFPTYPVEMALARYEQSGDVDALRALGVTEVEARPWLVSKTRGGIGLAAVTLQPKLSRAPAASRVLGDAVPLISACAPARVVQLPNSLGLCDVFFGDAQGFAPVRPMVAPSDSIDPQTAWIDARLAFPESPELAQGIGGALTFTKLSMPVVAASWLLAYVRGALTTSDGRLLQASGGGFTWIWIPPGATSVRCNGLCELVAQTARVAPMTATETARMQPLEFRRIAPWLVVVERQPAAAGLLRFNERYDSAWVAFASRRILQHVRLDSSVNAWILGPDERRIVLVQVTAVIQLAAEIVGIACVFWLLKALMRAPTKRAS
jgi:hypothetical protein